MGNICTIEEKIILKRESYDELNQTIADLENDVEESKKTIKTLNTNISEINNYVKVLQDYIIKDIVYFVRNYFEKFELESILDPSGVILKDYIEICKNLKIDTSVLKEEIVFAYNEYLEKESDRLDNTRG